MTEQHPITPSPELVERWQDEWMNNVLPGTAPQYIAIQAARWGADTELEACCEWLVNHNWRSVEPALRDARRPQPPSLKEQALALLDPKLDGQPLTRAEADTIRRALNQLPSAAPLINFRMTDPTPLSPAAQAVLDAACSRWPRCREWIAAAVLRAAVEVAVPEEPLHGGGCSWMLERDARQACRKKLLAIADELEGNLS